MPYKLIIPMSVLLIFGCNENKVYTVDQLVENDELRGQVNDRCKQLTLAEYMTDQGCKNVQSANSKILRKGYTDTGATLEVLTELPKPH